MTHGSGVRRGTRSGVGVATLGWLLGAESALCVTVVALAGSDLPPPPGFVAIIAIALAIVLPVRAGSAWLLRPELSSPVRSLGAAAVAGVIVGIVTVGILAVAVRLFEPTSSVTLPDVVILMTVVAIGGAVMAGLLAGTALIAAGVTSRAVAVSIAVAPAVVVLTPALAAIAVRTGAG